jgi:hypothetical membrane protein
MIKRKIVVFAGAIACFIGCAGDFISLFILGLKYPGYSQLSNTMSSLGSSSSPVSDLISVLWIILGGLIVIFAVGFRTAYSPADKYVKTAFWLIILYGLGEGLGSGLFKADLINNTYTFSFIIHDILGGAGVVAILILPLIVLRIKQFSFSRDFLNFSRIVLIVGILFLILFSFRFLAGKNIVISKKVAEYTGLWQRLLILDYYLYLCVIAVRMVKRDYRGKYVHP